jgi:hypothetical protein
MLGASSEFEQYTTNEVMMFFIHALALNLFLLSSSNNSINYYVYMGNGI